MLKEVVGVVKAFTFENKDFSIMFDINISNIKILIVS